MVPLSLRLRPDTSFPPSRIHLQSVNFYIPFVDVLKDGKTPFSKPTIGYINQLIPVVVADLELNGQHVGVFDPKHAPYKTIGDGSELAITVSEGLDNPVSIQLKKRLVSRTTLSLSLNLNILCTSHSTQIDGPGLLIPRFQANFKKTSKAHISAKTFKEVALQPRVNPLGLCSQTIEYYNETFADPSHVVGSVQVYSPVVPQNQQFETAYGWTVTSEWIAPAGVGKKCSDFA